MNLLKVVKFPRKKKITIHDITIMVPTHYTADEAKKAFTDAFVETLKSEGMAMAAIDDKKDRAFAANVGIGSMQYEWLRDHWFGNWLKLTEKK
jgi:hypothetical protein